MNNESILKEIMKVTLPLEKAKVSSISAQIVAEQVLKNIDPDMVSPTVISLAARLHITEIARRTLAKRHDPVSKAHDSIAEDHQGDLWGGVLQDRYPVKRNGIRLYVLKEHCSLKELIKCASRMAKAGGSLIEHSDAILSYVQEGSSVA